jgi:hypothetical protein
VNEQEAAGKVTDVQTGQVGTGVANGLARRGAALSAMLQPVDRSNACGSSSDWKHEYCFRMTPTEGVNRDNELLENQSSPSSTLSVDTTY